MHVSICWGGDATSFLWHFLRRVWFYQHLWVVLSLVLGKATRVQERILFGKILSWLTVKVSRYCFVKFIKFPSILKFVKVCLLTIFFDYRTSSIRDGGVMILFTLFCIFPIILTGWLLKSILSCGKLQCTTVIPPFVIGRPCQPFWRHGKIFCHRYSMHLENSQPTTRSWR